MGETMSAQITRPTGIMAIAFLLLVWGSVLSVPGNSAFAGDCVPAPNSPAPADSHWYYRTDRTQQRQCWYLRAANEPSQPVAVPTRPTRRSLNPRNLGRRAAIPLPASRISWRCAAVPNCLIKRSKNFMPRF